MKKHPIAEADEESPFGKLSPAEFYAKHGVSHSSEYFTNPRGLRLFTQWWLPLSSPPLACVAVVHGFTGESSWFVQLTSVLFASSGFAVCALDHQGHGFSDGLLHHIPDLSPVVDDCQSVFSSFRNRHVPGLPAFLYSESLGGAIALYLTLRQPGAWDGLVLNGAMCGISDKFKPPWPLEHLLGVAATLIPTWRVVPTRGSIPGVSFKEEWKRRLATASPRRVVARPRAATAKELLRVCAELQGRFEEVKVPLLIVHGGDDVVCDPECVRDLHARASSLDKTLKIYPGMWHQLIGEPEEGVDLVFGDILDWLTTRAERARAAAAATAVNGGAGDCSSCVAVMLELARGISQWAHGFKNAVIFLFNTGEEEGLNGAHSFVTQHPWSSTVRMAIDLEAMGVGGKSSIFQAGPQPLAIETFASAAKYPFGHVIAQTSAHCGKSYASCGLTLVLVSSGAIPPFTENTARAVNVVHVVNANEGDRGNGEPSSYISLFSTTPGKLTCEVEHMKEGFVCGEDKVIDFVTFSVKYGCMAHDDTKAGWTKLDIPILQVDSDTKGLERITKVSIDTKSSFRWSLAIITEEIEDFIIKGNSDELVPVGNKTSVQGWHLIQFSGGKDAPRKFELTLFWVKKSVRQVNSEETNTEVQRPLLKLRTDVYKLTPKAESVLRNLPPWCSQFGKSTLPFTLAFLSSLPINIQVVELSAVVRHT